MDLCSSVSYTFIDQIVRQDGRYMLNWQQTSKCHWKRSYISNEIIIINLFCTDFYSFKYHNVNLSVHSQLFTVYFV